MKRRAFLLGAATLLVSAGVAEARMHAPYRGHRIVPVASGPIDGFATPSGAYSFRKLRSAYAGFAVKLQRVDTTTQDIGFVGGDFDTVAATAFCTTACTVNTLYDQSGNGRDVTQAVAANQPAYIANCNGSLPCAQVTTATQLLASAGNLTPATGVVSFSVVANRVSGVTAACTWLRENGTTGNRIRTGTAATQWQTVGGGGGTLTAAAADNSWHAAQATINGASSTVAIDGTTTTGTSTGNTVAGTVQVLGGAAATCNMAEGLLWDAYILAPAEVAALNTNQRNYWMPAPLDSFTTPSGAYSFRKLKSTYSGPAARLRRASDNAETDINFLGFTGFTGAPWDEAAANAHCAATSCFLRTWYDQSGNARDLAQTTTANQPELVFNCNGALPCFRMTAATHQLAGPVFTPATGVVSLNVVARRTAGTGICAFLRENSPGNRLVSTGGTGSWQINGGTSGAVPNANATENVWHSAIGVINTTSSVMGIDGIEGTSTATGSVTAAAILILGVAATTCDESEAIFWDAYAMPPAERAALTANQRSFWGTP